MNTEASDEQPVSWMTLKHDPRSLDELFEAAFDGNEDRASDAIGALHWRGTGEVLDRAVALCGSELVTERECGASILGQLGIPDRAFPERCFGALLPLLTDDALDVVDAAICALGYLGWEAAVPHIVPFQGHPDADIRFSAAFALGCFDTLEAAEALITLTGDPEPDVRDWATFGLGRQMQVDTPEAREALAARLDDDDDNVRYEAACGLGLRRDRRAIETVISMLEMEPDNFSLTEAGSALLGITAEASLPPAEMLKRLRSIGQE